MADTLIVQLKVTSNFPEGKTDLDYVKNHITNYLEQMAGVGLVEVLSIEPDVPVEDRVTIPTPKPDTE